MVKRWDGSALYAMALSDDGEYVLASDYDALAAALAEANARIAELAAMKPATMRQRVEELEAVMKMVIARTDNPWVVHKLSNALKATPAETSEGYSQGYADQMRTALLEIVSHPTASTWGCTPLVSIAARGLGAASETDG